MTSKYNIASNTWVFIRVTFYNYVRRSLMTLRLPIVIFSVPTRAVFHFRVELEYDSDSNTASSAACQMSYANYIQSLLPTVGVNLAGECDSRIDLADNFEVVVTPQISDQDFTLRYDTQENKVHVVHAVFISFTQIVSSVPTWWYMYIICMWMTHNPVSLHVHVHMFVLVSELCDV